VEYKYPTASEFSWGYAEYFGKYYADYDINKSVVSLSLFTDSLYINDDGELDGYGQYLFLEDIFSSPSSMFLPEGTYNISGSRESFTIAKGEITEIDGIEYTIGAYIYFIEKNAQYSKLETIIGGNFTLSYDNSNYYILCNFTLSDSTQYTGQLNYREIPLYDESVNYLELGVPRKKLKIAGEAINP